MMAGRCKSCNQVLTDGEMTSKDEFMVYYDTCSSCRTKANYALYSDEEEDSIICNDFYKPGRRLTQHHDDD